MPLLPFLIKNQGEFFLTPTAFLNLSIKSQAYVGHLFRVKKVVRTLKFGYQGIIFQDNLGDLCR